MRFPSRLLSLLALLASLAAISPAATVANEHEVTITRVFAGWRDAASFKRISEYFTGKENPSGAILLRTHADQRAGFYFLVRIANPGAPVTVKIAMEVLTPTDTKPKNYSFTADLTTGSNLLNIGLTANDWPDAKANPVAWKIDFVAADGRVLAGTKSYLWENPLAK
jgi:hypothetical protein